MTPTCGGAPGLLIVFLALPALAVEPDEMLDDPILEACADPLGRRIALRAMPFRVDRVLATPTGLGMRGSWCVNSSPAARPDDEVLDFFVERYGEVVLMRPRAKVRTSCSGSPPRDAAAGGRDQLRLISAAARAARAPDEDLTAEEQARLDQLLGRDADSLFPNRSVHLSGMGMERGAADGVPRPCASSSTRTSPPSHSRVPRCARTQHPDARGDPARSESAERSARVLVLTGAGEAFCSGQESR